MIESLKWVRVLLFGFLVVLRDKGKCDKVETIGIFFCVAGEDSLFEWKNCFAGSKFIIVSVTVLSVNFPQFPLNCP